MALCVGLVFMPQSFGGLVRGHAAIFLLWQFLLRFFLHYFLLTDCSLNERAGATAAPCPCRCYAGSGAVVRRVLCVGPRHAGVAKTPGTLLIARAERRQ